MLTWRQVVHNSVGGLAVSALESDQVSAGSQLELSDVLWTILDGQG